MTIMTKKKLHKFRILSFTKKNVKTYCEQIITYNLLYREDIYVC